MEKNRKVTPALFAFALICFFMPFFHVSCQSQRLMSFTGLQLVTGTNIEEPSMFGPRRTREVSGEPLALLAFLCGLGGLGLGFVKSRRSAVLPAAAGGLGVLLLLLLKSKLDDEITAQGRGLLQVDFAAGFWLALLLYLAAAVLNAYAFAQARREATVGGPEPETPV